MPIPKIGQVIIQDIQSSTPGFVIINYMTNLTPPAHDLKHNGAVFLLICFCVFAVYSVILISPFKTMDDQATIVLNPDIRSFGNLPKVFLSPFFRSNYYYRPLVTTTYMAEYHLFGLNPFFYYFDQLVLHSLNVFLVFLLAGLLLGNRHQALAAAILFGIHPIHWEAVTNVSGRAILLSSFFVLLGLIAFLRSRTKPSIWLITASTLFYALALLSKESGGILLIVALTYLLIFERTATAREPTRILSLLPFGLMALLYTAIRLCLNIGQPNPWSDGRELFLGFSTFLAGIWTYLRLLVLPDGFIYDRSIELCRSFADPRFWCAWSAFAVAAYLLWYKRKKISPLFFFCLFWFLLELVPASQVMFAILIQPGRISLAEHFVYLASVPFFIVVVLLVGRVSEWLTKKSFVSPSALKIIGICLYIFLGLITFKQAVFSSNEFVMLRDSLRQEPQNARLHLALGLFYIRVQKPDQAEKYFEKAVRLDPGCTHCRLALGKALFDQGRLSESLTTYQQTHPTNLRDEELLRDYQTTVERALNARHQP